MVMITRGASAERVAKWGRVQLKDVVLFRSGSRNTNTASAGGEFPFFVCSSEVLRCNEFDVDDEVVIMAGNNADGVFHLHYFVGKFAARQRTYIISPKTERLDCRWLFHQLGILQPQFQAAAIGTTTQYVTIDMLRSAEILLPDVESQRHIAGALSDVDGLLDGLNRLIAKKRDLKQAAMQQLLADQKRLPGFTGEWKVKTLGDTCTFENGDRGANYPSPKSFVHSGVPFVNAGHVEDGRISRGGMDYITRESYDRLGGGKFKSGDILFCLRGSLGKFGVVDLNFSEGAIASSLVIVRPKSTILHTDYLVCYLKSHLCDQMIERWAGGAAQPNLGAQDLSKFLIPLPPFPEQTAIAEVLTDMEAELAALERRREKTGALKQAMMQELMTGRTRLI